MRLDVIFDLPDKLIDSHELDLKRNKLYIAVSYDPKIGENGQYHSGIVAVFDGEGYLFHYPGGKKIQEQRFPFSEKYILKEISSITQNQLIVSAFIGWCRKVSSQSSIYYGYLFGVGSYVQGTGKFKSNGSIPEISNCVGYCANILTTFLEVQSYLALETWPLVPLEANKYYLRFFEGATLSYPQISEDEYRKHHRNIPPIHIFCSAFYNKTAIPISNTHILSIDKEVHNAFHDKLEE